MIENDKQLRVTLQQLGRLVRALEDLKENVLPNNPALFGSLAEGCLEDIERLRAEIEGYVGTVKSAG